VTDFAEMCRKTVVRRLCKYLPLSTNLAEALELDAEADERARLPDIDVMASAADEPKAKAIAKRLRAAPLRPAGSPRSTEFMEELTDPLPETVSKLAKLYGPDAEPPPDVEPGT
jgi:recombinational DNA repair protein RecT